MLTPLVFVDYYIVLVLHDGDAVAIWHIAGTEYVVITLLAPFLAADRDGVVEFTCIDTQMCGIAHGVLVPVSYGVRAEMDDVGLLEGLCGIEFDPVPSSVAYSQSSQVDWTWVGPTQL